jgi:hypothetical protein
LLDVYENSFNELNNEIKDYINEINDKNKIIIDLTNENEEYRSELEIKYNNMLNNKKLFVGSVASLSEEEREEFLDHIDKLTEENTNLLMLNDRLSRRADESLKELQSKSKNIEEKLKAWFDMELALNYTRERELNLKSQKELLEIKLSSQMEQIGEIEREKEI